MTFPGERDQRRSHRDNIRDISRDVCRDISRHVCRDVRRTNVDRGSATPIMMATVALALGAMSLTVRVGGEYLEMSRIDAAADAVALAMASGDGDLGREIAVWNRVRITGSQMSGDRESGFDVWVTVAALDGSDRVHRDGSHQGRARATTKP